MKTVLVLAHWYYPIYHGGVPRVAKFCKYLSDFGITPVLVAPDWQCFTRWPKSGEPDSCEVIRVADDACVVDRPSRIKKLLLSPFRDNEDVGYGRLERKMLKAAEKVCRDREIDAIFASSYPQYIHRIASRLHRKTGIKWVADHRDLVDQEPYAPRSRFRLPETILMEKIYRPAYIARDMRYTKTASHITTVSDALAERLRARGVAAPVTVIMNGFDPEDYAGVDRQVRNDRLTVRYTGSVYGNSRIDRLGEGYAMAVESCPGLADSIVFEFYGTSCKKIGRMLRPYPELEKAAALCGSLSHDAIVRKQCGADILYLISHPSKGIVTGKLFEYLAAGKRILSVPGDGDATDRILRESGAGFAADTPEKVCGFLCAAYEEWKRKGCLEVNADEEYVARFSRRGCAEKLAEILSGI